MAMNRVVIYRMTYPERSTHCVPVKLGETTLALARFQSKESAFRAIAEQFGIDHKEGRFTRSVERSKGITFDHSSLIVPGENGEYIKIGHYC